MFRMLKLKPPHGWDAVAWELVIVTVGVLMALALQQWAEDVGSQSKVKRARDAIRQELRDHYFNAVEWRTFSPCVSAQLDRIEDRLTHSRSALQPIELHHLSGIRVAVMAPGRIYDDSAWQGAINDGTALQLTDLERGQLTNEHWLAANMDKNEDVWASADQELLAATRPIDLNAEVRLALIRSIDRLHAINERMSESAAEIIFWVDKVGAAPSRADTGNDLKRNSSTMRQFCKDQQLPTHDLTTALNPNS